MSVAAWHPTDDPMYSTPKSPKNTLPARRTVMIHECFYTISMRDVTTSRRNSRRSRKTHESRTYLGILTPSLAEDGCSPSVDLSLTMSPLVHSLVSPQALSPSVSSSQIVTSLSIPRCSAPSPTFSPSSPSPPPMSLVDTLRDGVMDAIDIGVMVLSADGAVAVRNQKWLDIGGSGEVGSFHLARNSPTDSEDGSSSPPRRDFTASILSQISTWHPSIVLMDVDFTSEIKPVDHPLYQAAILGRVVTKTRYCAVQLEGEAHYIQPRRKEEEDSSVELNKNPYVPQPPLSVSHLENTNLSVEHDNSPAHKTPIFERTYTESSVSELISKSTKLILEISARPMRDTRGELIGGIMTMRDVTWKEKERMENIHRESDMQFEQVCDSLPQIVWITRPQGYVTYFSKWLLSHGNRADRKSQLCPEFELPHI
ncbi:hypothetical protein RSAG8_07651, partial [Rhizoctonia solani AG-8 WAC10335]